MSNYSKRVSEMWQNLSEDEKIEWKRRYELNREFRLDVRKRDGEIDINMPSANSSIE
uniref:Uncharacterized protein n=1 Tax=Rhizophagus irregularis (strain DAOM 181602 / DAOM 197198 / MUCL 43194) TaxID=747089 RepID=U9TLH4_RHIID